MPAKIAPPQSRVSDVIANAVRCVSNLRREMPNQPLPDYVLLDITGDFVEREELQPWPLRFLPQTRRPSVEGLRQAMEHIAEDPQVQGVVLRIHAISSALATLQSLRQIIIRFRDSGKRVVAYLEDIDLRSYYLATAADNILAPESATFLVLGLAVQSVFLKDALGRIGIKGDFAPWVGSMIPDVKHPLLIVADAGMEDEVVTRLARVGYDNVMGFLKGGIAAWKADGKEVDTIERIDATEFAKRFHAGKLRVVDVRKDGEYAAEHVDGAWHASLQFINQNLAAFSKEETNYVHCAGGYRSMIAASLLKSRGYHNLVEVRGGFNAIKGTDVKVTDYVCPSTLKK